MSISVSGSQITFNDASTQNTAATGFGFKNRIINGAMVIDQRNAGASVTPTTDGTYTLDRWRASLSQASKFSVQRNAGSVTPPAGYINYLGVNSLSAYSVTATDTFSIQQNIEGLNLSDLGWGTASAQTVTLSFWIRSSLTGTFGGVINNGSYNRSYPFTYTISSANTWEQKTVTIAGDTTGTWLTTNGIGMVVSFDLGTGTTYKGTAGAWAAGYYNSATGATSVVGTNGATFYITGVQLEKGPTATSFDYRPYGTELQLCQRYYQRFIAGGAYTAFGLSVLCSGATSSTGTLKFDTTMRTTPSAMDSSAASTFMITDGTNNTACTSVGFAAVQSNEKLAQINFGTAGGLTQYRPYNATANNNASSYIGFTAEL